MIHPGPDRTRCFCSGLDPAQTRNLPFLAIFLFFAHFLWPIFTILWVKTQSRTQPGPEIKPVDPARTRPENFFSGSQTPGHHGQGHHGRVTMVRPPVALEGVGEVPTVQEVVAEVVMAAPDALLQVVVRWCCPAGGGGVPLVVVVVVMLS